MENNVVNIEQGYFEKRDLQIQKLLASGHYLAAKKLLKETLTKIEKKLKGAMVLCPQNMIEKRIMLNLLGKEASTREFSKINYYNFYLMMGNVEYNLQHFGEARKYYRKAIELNPTDSKAKLQILKMNQMERKYDMIIADLNNLFKFAYKKKEVAAAYRYLGYYLCEIKDYEMSLVAYFNSIVYEINEMAMKEIDDIIELEGIKLGSKECLSDEYLNKLCYKYHISAKPNEDVVNIIVGLAEKALAKNSLKVAKRAYKIAYELTLNLDYVLAVDEV